MRRSSWTVGKQGYESDMSWLLYQDIVQLPNVQMLHNVIKHQNISPSHSTAPPPPPPLTKRKNVSRPTKPLQRLPLLINSGSSLMHTRKTETVRERNERGAGWESVRQWKELTLQLLLASVGSVAGRVSNWSLLGNALSSLWGPCSMRPNSEVKTRCGAHQFVFSEQFVIVGLIYVTHGDA